MPNFLLECCSEEIPARMQRPAREQLERLFKKHLDKEGLAYGAIQTFSAPRHLAIHIADIPDATPERHEERKGPKVGAPDKAIEGFLSSVGKTREQCEQRRLGKDSYYIATISEKGRKANAILSDIGSAVLAEFTWPKSMRWGERQTRWVRPLHHIVALLDDEVLPIELGHLVASNQTLGHRFLSPSAITITHADEYISKLYSANIVIEPKKRAEEINRQIHALATNHGLTLVEDPALLEEVTGLVEAPTAMLGSFEARFLALPPEVLISEMKHHQRYFALTKQDGSLSNHFITVTNMAAPTDIVLEGNARVLRARLSDGDFFYHTDQQTPLATWAEKLKDVVFHAKVGMMSEKVARIETLALHLNTRLPAPLDPALVAQAAQLCKADLTTGMVGEFPELQGVMGRYYALKQGVHDKVAEAIYEHYKPQGASDDLPKTDLGALIAVADKLDSIQSLFAAGEKPTGSKDPLALRRAALGILRILLDKTWHISIEDITLIPFFRDRMSQLLRDEGIAHDIVEAAISNETSRLIPVYIAGHARALARWATTDAGTQAIRAIKRAQNILSAEEKKGDVFTFASMQAGALTMPAERNLHSEVAYVLHMDTEYQSPPSLDQLATLGETIHAFFDDVLVNADDPQLRTARLSLLAGVRECANKVADFSKLEG
jgi:glycyl-tRNA synthetase beta chain